MGRKILEKDMDALSTTLTIPAGCTICKDGQLAREAMLILEGEVDIIKGDDVIATVAAGELIGELALVDGTSSRFLRSATVITTTPCTVKVMNPREFATLTKNSAAFRELLTASIKNHTSA